MSGLICAIAGINTPFAIAFRPFQLNAASALARTLGHSVEVVIPSSRVT